jgi:SAM-dependent MidA family methyltransferase
VRDETPDGQVIGAAIRDEIAARGPIPFARFMELCLYHPRHGYYARGAGGGGGRDYLTSSGIHRAFGSLVARQAEEMWRRTGRPDPFWFVEFGPGEGYFALDFLETAGRSRGFARALHYLLVEPSPALRARQRTRLEGRAPVPLEWVAEEEIDRRAPLAGCLFANEVLDAFPVHRVIGTADGPREVHVAVGGSGLEEVVLPCSTEAIGRFLEEAGIALEEGQEVDLNLAAPCWMSWSVRLLSRGYLMLIDYGHEARDLYHPARRRGTLLAYHRHRTSEEFLRLPGDQDLTAHVDFTALQRSAERAGARTLGLTTQARFLLALGALDLVREIQGEGQAPEGAAPGSALRSLRETEALKELILPGRMGDRFRVLVLGVGDVPRDLTGLSEPWAAQPGAALAGPIAPQPRARRPAEREE